jgi:hypothetical protein
MSFTIKSDYETTTSRHSERMSKHKGSMLSQEEESRSVYYIKPDVCTSDGVEDYDYLQTS